MNKKLIKFCEVTCVVLAVIGILTIMNGVHELTHYYDVINQNGSVESVCFVKLPLNYNDENITWYKRAGGEVIISAGSPEINSPKWKPVLISYIISIILVVIMLYGFWLGVENKVEGEI